jgi:hypothetical protein
MVACFGIKDDGALRLIRTAPLPAGADGTASATASQLRPS